MTYCLNHQLPEDHATPLGLLCSECKQHLYTQSPEGRCRSFWESQPGAYTLDGQPMFVYSIMWDDYRIRSLHPAGSDEDERRLRVLEYEHYRLELERREQSDSSFVPLPDDFGSIELTNDGLSEPTFDAEASEEPMEEDEHWLDLPDPESWIEIEWQPEPDDADGR